MAVSFKVPASPAKSVYSISEFQGVDLTNSPANIDDVRSPNAPNMTRLVPGKVRKRMGYETIHTFTTGEVLGCHVMKQTATTDVVTGVNRALGTATAASITTTTTDETWTDLYDLAEALSNTARFHIEFDYTYTKYTDNDYFYIYIGGNQLIRFYIRDTETEHSGHASHSLNPQTLVDDYDYSKIQLVTSDQIDITISNFTFSYGQPDSVDWSVAPEDGGSSFDLMNAFKNNSSSLFIDTSGTRTGTAEDGVWSDYIEWGDSTWYGYGYHYTCKYTTSTNDTVNSITIEAVSKNGEQVFSETYTENLVGEVIEFVYIPKTTDDYVYRIDVTFNVDGDSECVIHRDDSYIYTVAMRSSFYTASKTYIYHVGNTFYQNKSGEDTYTSLYTSANYARSMSWQFGNYLYIIDGKNMYKYDGENESLDAIDYDNATIPLVTIAKSPTGGGTSYQPLNLVQPGFEETFYGTASATDYYLSFSDLADNTVYAWILDSDGIWQTKTEDTDFTVDRTNGIITFTTAPGVSPLDGEDNVKIRAYRSAEDDSEKIKKCTVGALFGVNGTSDRLFLSGNPEYPNSDWYCEQYDPTYFPDTGYSILGQENSAIVGYAIINNYLAAFKDENEPSQSVFIREGDLVTNEVSTSLGTTIEITEPAFKLINTLQGASAYGKYTFGYLQTEPLFLTKKGIYAITAQDITGEKYGQNRSFYLDGELLKESDLDNAYACVYNNMYYLAINNKVYLLDGLQATRTDRSEPYSTRQYVAFHWNSIPASIIWTDNDYLWFGTVDGKICRFFTDVDDLYSYNDDGEAIDAWWETPDLDGKLFFKNKTFRYYAVRLMAALRTSVKMWAMKNGVWTLIKYEDKTGQYFDFDDIDFENFTFSTDQSEKVAHTKIKVKKVDKARFKLQNDIVNEPFGLFDIALEYIENGNYKG